MKEIEEIKFFLGHIQGRVGEAAFVEIWETVLTLEKKWKHEEFEKARIEAGK